MNYFLFLIPVLNAAFGWWLVESLFLFVFRPFDPIKIAGVTVQGVLPSLQKEIAEMAGEWAEQNITSEKLEAILLSDLSQQEMHVYFEEKADDFIRNKLTEKISFLKMFITEGIIVQAKEVLVEQLDKMIPEIIKGFVPKVTNRLNVKNEIESKIGNYPIQHIETQFFNKHKKKIRSLKLLACFIGFLIGLVEIAFIVF